MQAPYQQAPSPGAQTFYPPTYLGQQPPPGYNPMAAPALQLMTTNLEAYTGLVVRQETQLAEAVLQAIEVPYEEANKYKVSALPFGKHAAREHDQPDKWVPTGPELKALPELFRVQEESDCFLRVILTFLGCANLRPLKLHYLQPGGGEFLTIDRPFRMGAWLCCPLEMTVMQGPTIIGKVEEDCGYCNNCIECFWCCTCYNKLYETTTGAPVLKYTVRTNFCCCGRVDNCCGATCCKNDFIIDVLDTRGNIVTTFQKTYAPEDNCKAFCRCCFEFSNYIVEFPPDASHVQRALLTAAMFQIDYDLFEKTGNDNSDDSGGGDTFDV